MDIRPHRRRRRTGQSYSSDSANVPPMRTHWRHLANTTEHMLPSAHPRTQPKWPIDRFSHFCTLHGRVSSSMPGHVLSPNNCPFAWDLGPWPNLNPASLGPPVSITQTASRSVQPFCRAHDRDRQTDRQTTLYSVCTNRPASTYVVLHGGVYIGSYRPLCRCLCAI